MDYMVHGILQARILEWVAFPFSRGIFPTQGSNPCLPYCRWILYQLSHKGSPRIPEWVAYPFSSGFSQPKNWTGFSHIAGGFFTNWAIREAQSCTDAPQTHPAKVHILYVSSPQHFWHRNWFHGRQFFHGPGKGGVVSGWFKHITFIVHFISSLMLALIWQEIPAQPRAWGPPAVYVLTHHKRRHGPWCSVTPLLHSE